MRIALLIAGVIAFGAIVNWSSSVVPVALGAVGLFLLLVAVAES